MPSTRSHLVSAVLAARTVQLEYSGRNGRGEERRGRTLKDVGAEDGRGLRRREQTALEHVLLELQVHLVAARTANSTLLYNVHAI